MYLNGCGAPLDRDLASQWFSKAPEMGHPEAQVGLSELLLTDGASAPRAAIDAWMWAQYALVRLPSDARVRRRALEARDRAFRRLSPDEQEEAAWLFNVALQTEREIQAQQLAGHRNDLNSLWQRGGRF